MKSYSIYIVEDMGVTRATLLSILTRNNHIVLGSSATAEKAWLEISQLKPDLVLLDINLKGVKSGIWLANKIKTVLNIPFIFITAYGCNDIINKIAQIKPAGYIMKPFNNATLLANIQLSVSNFNVKKKLEIEDNKENIPFLIKTKNGIEKILLNDILYAQSEGNMVYIYFKNKQFTCRYKLDDLLNEFNNHQIKKTHRRFAININKITRINKKTAFIKDLEIPISKTYLSDIENLFQSIIKKTN
ncbi:MAG: response regulator transcription factor [Polaribacter sp.]|uniref:LytR/AlgR family response regulator transcription factor n=1 Tax=Polaribacter sp. TaxID=1920175 RepID=UPI003267B7DF